MLVCLAQLDRPWNHGDNRRRRPRLDLLSNRQTSSEVPLETFRSTGAPSRRKRTSTACPAERRHNLDSQRRNQPTKYWLSTLPETIAFVDLVDTAKLRWRIERDYQELKQEVGLGHYEGRGWRGFHHHATLCIAAYGFLISEREAFPPSGPRTTLHGAKAAVPRRGRPDSPAHPTGAPRAQLHRHHAPHADRCSRQEPRSMSMLPCATTRDQPSHTFVTQ